MKNRIAIIVVATALLGCQTTQQAPSKPVENSRTFNASKAAVWPLVVSELSVSMPVKVIEKESGLLQTEMVTLPAGYGNMFADKWVKPPGGLLATWAGLRGAVTANVIEIEPGKTTVSLRPHYEAFESNVTKSWIVCESNGKLEAVLFDSIASKLPK